MKRTDLPQQLQEILRRVAYVTLATVCPDGQPWNTPVFGCFDENLNLFWASWTKNQHSRNIADNANLFAVIYDSRTAEGDGLALYLQMTAKVLNQEKEVVQAREFYRTDFGENLKHEPFLGKCPRRLYKAVPLKIWHNANESIRGDIVDVRRSITPSV